MPFIAFLLELVESITAAGTQMVQSFILAPSLGYIRWLTAFMWVPEIIDVTIYKEIVIKHWRIFPALAVTVEAIGIPWDYFSVADGLWAFPKHIIGIWLLGLPLEEHLWMISFSWLMALLVLFFYRVKVRRNVRKL